MKKPSRTEAERIERNSAQKNDMLLAHVAILYYKDGLTQSEIAKRLGVSRATVVNYLRSAREQNIVDIRISGSSFVGSRLSRDLKERFGLEDVYIAIVFPGTALSLAKQAAEIRRQVARVGAMALCDLVQAGNVLGVAWGETIRRLSEELPRSSVRNLTVCQLIGSMKSPLLSAAETCAIRIASNLGADCYTLHAPAVLTSAKLAEERKVEPIIQTQLQRLNTLTKTLFSVGNCETSTHIIQAGITTQKELDWYRSQGAVGVICGRFIDASGRHIEGKVDARMISITPAQMKKVKTGILVASGTEKIEVIKAALAGGYATHLIIVEPTGKQLLS